MHIQHTILPIPAIRTIDWYGENVIDWNSAGTVFLPNGTTQQTQKYHFGFKCDAAISSENGEYAFIYKKLATKGLLLKNGEIHREINRSYYQSEVYEYPATFCTLKGKTYLIHCPYEYCRLDIEDVETGEILTNVPNRKPQDIFHSRLEVSVDNRFLVSKGWVWHPYHLVEIFDIEKCIQNPHELDTHTNFSDFSFEISSAHFLDEKRILIYIPEDFAEHQPSSPHLAVWNFENKMIEKHTKTETVLGNIFTINQEYTWDLYAYPKIIDINTGKVVAKVENINSGFQCSSIIGFLDEVIKISFNKRTKQVALLEGEKLHILTPIE